MSRLTLPLAALTLLTACGSASLTEQAATVSPPTTTPTAPDGGTVTDLSGASSTSAVSRYETKDTNGNGYAQSITYNATNDTFAVDNLAFDGGNSYTRSAAMADIGGSTPTVNGAFKVYEGPADYPDSVTGTPIAQFLHRAIYAESTQQVNGKPQSRFAIVRTGSYMNYGFGGFLYERNGSVTIPRTGQANYAGQYAGLIDYNGQGGIKYVSGDMTMQIDFEDFNEGAAIAGAVTNRHIYNMDGSEYTASYLAALNSDLGYSSGGYSALPTLVLTVVAGGLMTSNGEFGAGASSAVVNSSGTIVSHESGNYYAVLSGDATQGGQDQVVGVIVVESTTPLSHSTMRETGGFILYRN